MSLSITQLIALAGEDNVRCQWLHHSSAGWIFNVKKGTTCRFHTARENMPNLDGTCERVGIVLWFERDVVEKAEHHNSTKEP
jgi:hypothetical protein